MSIGSWLITLILFPLSRVAAPYDKFGRAFASAGFIAQRFLTPRRSRIFGGTMTAAVSAAVRMIGGIHNYTADTRTNPFVTITPGFANLDILVLLVADNTK